MKLQPREYQQKIINSIKINGNTLVVLPTGLGKTLIALSLMEKTEGKCVFLTPTKPLAKQHSNTITDILGEIEGGSVLVTGESTPKKRAELYQLGQILEEGFDESGNSLFKMHLTQQEWDMVRKWDELIEAQVLEEA